MLKIIDNLIFSCAKSPNREQSPSQGNKRRKNVGPAGIAQTRAERLSSEYKKRDRKPDDPYEIAGNLIIENMSVNSLNSGFVTHLPREVDPYEDGDSMQLDRCKCHFR